MSERAVKEIASVYLHVGDSGATFSIVDEYGPTFRIESSSFGNLNHSFEVKTNMGGLRKIRDMIDQALLADFSEEYCYSAKLVDLTERGSDSMEGNSDAM